MRFLFRLIPILFGLANIAAFIWLSFKPHHLIFILIFLGVVLGYGTFELLGQKWKEKDFLCSFTIMALFEWSGIIFFSYLDGWFGKIFIALVVTIILVLFSELLYRWFYSKERIPSYSLGVTITILELLIFFFLSSDLIGFKIFIRLPSYLMILSFAVFTFLIFVSTRWIRGVGSKRMIFGILLGLFFAEIMWAILLLPTIFMVGGAVVAVLWYAVSGIIRVYESGLKLSNVIHRYAAIATLLIVMIILTARWV